MINSHASKTRKARTLGFVINPFKRIAGRDLPLEREAHKEFVQYRHGKAPSVYFLLNNLVDKGAVKRTKYGLVMDWDRMYDAALKTGVDWRHKLLYSTVLADERNPADFRGINRDSLSLIKQLRSLGHKVYVQDDRDRGRAAFIKVAKRLGAEGRLTEKSATTAIKSDMELPIWARDQYAKIGGRKVKPRAEKGQFFGEGGHMIQVGPKEYLISETAKLDPRVAGYERKGYKFHGVPSGVLYERSLSNFLGVRVYSKTPHIDLNLGGIPKMKILAVDPEYYLDHKKDIQTAKGKFGLKIVEVPGEEAGRHPANFLLLGNKRVLVDSGAPKFIERLREAGVDVVPTSVPLDSLLTGKGGVRCLFNEA